jgi:predicted nucleic acid-binding Zn ribbon protein
MDCPNCGKWNPEDKNVCWRCQTPLPKPQPKKPRRTTFAGLPIWMWVALILFLLISTFGSCMTLPAPGA